MNILNLTFEELKQRYTITPILSIPDNFNNLLTSAAKFLITIPQNNNILIFTDSNDLDGISGGAILYLTLNYLGYKNVKIYGTGDRNTLPDDINTYNLVITNDVGINIDWTNYKNNLIVLDHHATFKQQQQTQNRYFICLCNICGAYISYLFCLKLSKTLPTYLQNLIFEYSALATISDCMPINNINKRTIQQLYTKIKNTDNNDNNLDIDISNIKLNSNSISEEEPEEIESKALFILLKSYLSSFTYSTIPFYVIPKLNAPMKLNNDLKIKGEYFEKDIEKYNWQIVFKLLIECEDNKIEKYVAILNELNNERKGITNKLTDEIVKLLENKTFEENVEHIENNNQTIKIDYNKNLIDIYAPIQNHITGLIASKLTEIYKIPVAIHGVCSSSIRGKGALEILEQNKDKLKTFGGHKEAAGFQMKTNTKLEAKNVKNNIIKQDVIMWNNNFDYNEIKDWINDNAPFYVEPIFLKNIIIKDIKIFCGCHTKIISDKPFEFIAFNKLYDLNIGDNVQIVFKINGNSNIIIELNKI